MSRTSHLPTTIDRVKQCATEGASPFYFTPDTMRFFDSRVLSRVAVGVDHAFFVTSERFDYQSPRLYTVRSIDARGHVDTVGDFQGHRTAGKAHDAARAAAEAESPAVRFVAHYAPDVFEVIHPERERIGSVTRHGRRAWAAQDAYSRDLGTFSTRRAAAVAIVASSER